MRTPLIAGNWKMYKTVAEAVDLVEELIAGLDQVSDREVVICPPFTALYPLAPLLADGAIQLGAQNMYGASQGAFTGEVSPVMLQELNCRYVILGHSERRQVFGENDALINTKVRTAIENSIRPILCIGETKPQRDAGQAEEVTLGQLRAGLGGLTVDQLQDLVIAYEPVWAIGTGDTATPRDAQAMHAAIRASLAEHFGQDLAQRVRILYGGSVKPDNVDTLMSQADIDGALVGGASLQAESFLRIVEFR
ncbi:MAG: Triosephosphate isomerase [uncultured Chloroflexia bacterium]|uniref:Triosephosphate isomerase n=1 Tax=uncultured Chloroflexia bacterium TaxID=1672391 RepID=A0A6J4I4V7_9CHLR|nr:MAG: Triosephosphate isomerase [uncultured Chloroflexia bacterium]